jgi:nicotinamide riboside kinase
MPDAVTLSAMKVAFVGSFSTGKTTLATAFAREWDYPLLPEVAREVVALGFPLDQGATAETEALIFLKQWRAEATHERFVADRSVYDVLAYADWVMEHSAGRRKEDHLWYEAREIAILDLRARYDHVFYLPVEFPIVLDGLRPDSPDFQADIDVRIRQLLEGEDVPYLTLTGGVEERQEQVRNAVGAVVAE